MPKTSGKNETNAQGSIRAADLAGRAHRREDAGGVGEEAVGERRLDAQVCKANIDPSERYVLSLPGTGKYWIESDGTDFDDLYLAGDWTDNGINAGCMEAAVLSGLQAARGISGEPELIVGEKDGLIGV